MHGLQVKVPFSSFLARAARRVAARAGAAEPLDEEALVSELKAAFVRIDMCGAEGASRVSAEEVCCVSLCGSVVL